MDGGIAEEDMEPSPPSHLALKNIWNGDLVKSESVNLKNTPKL
jgi:hypothetical protein